jgi:hypothetical protein
LFRPREIYRSASDDLRKTMNFICFDKLYIDIKDDEPVVSDETIAEAVKPLTTWLEQAGSLPPRSLAAGHAKNPEPSLRAQGSIRTGVVVDTGIEPVTPRV